MLFIRSVAALLLLSNSVYVGTGIRKAKGQGPMKTIAGVPVVNYDMAKGSEDEHQPAASLEEQVASEGEKAAAMADVASSVDAPLGVQNFLNLGAYVLNFLVTYGSNIKLFGPDNKTLSAKYQTLITPKGTAFAIWGIIFIGELVFCILQMLPAYRASKVVTAITPWWVASCAFQVAWTPTFAKELIPVAEFWMSGILASLFGLIISADAVGGLNFGEYMGLRFAFGVHAGWLVCALAVQTSTWAVQRKIEQEGLLGLAITSLCAVLICSTIWATAVPTPEPLIPLVAAWANYFIYAELNNGATILLDSTRENYLPWDKTTLAGVRLAASFSSLLAVGLALVALWFRLRLLL